MKRNFLNDSENAEISLAQICFEQLENDIIQGVLKPGEKLKVEPLKERFDVGQSPIREALSKLSGLGLVESEENRGFRVTSVSEADIRDCFAVMTIIENICLAWSMQQGDDDLKANIVAQLYKLSLVEQDGAIRSYQSWVERNYEFHLALIAGCKSPLLLELRRFVYSRFDRYCRISYRLLKNKFHSNYEHHEKLAQAVLARDVALSEKLMTEHINGSLESIIEIFKDNDLF